jgi:hypothetical protein
VSAQIGRLLERAYNPALTAQRSRSAGAWSAAADRTASKPPGERPRAN